LKFGAHDLAELVILPLQRLIFAWNSTLLRRHSQAWTSGKDNPFRNGITPIAGVETWNQEDTATLAAVAGRFLGEGKKNRTTVRANLFIMHYRPKPISFRPIQPTEESTHAAENCIQEQRAELFRPLLSSR
jgi:hypothetical protein